MRRLPGTSRDARTGARVAPAARIGLNRSVTALSARLDAFARMPSGRVAVPALISNNNAENNNRTRKRVGDQA
jgi:hypothetical protein